jgi:hypothetical protein
VATKASTNSFPDVVENGAVLIVGLAVEPSPQAGGSIEIEFGVVDELAVKLIPVAFPLLIGTA